MSDSFSPSSQETSATKKPLPTLSNLSSATASTPMKSISEQKTISQLTTSPQKSFDRLKELYQLIQDHQPLTKSQHPLIEKELSKLFAHFLHEFIDIWFMDISHDEEFLIELIHVFKQILANIENLLLKVWVFSFFPPSLYAQINCIFKVFLI